MLTAQQIEQYREQGYVVVSGIFTTQQLDEMEREFDGIIQRRLARRANISVLWQGDWQKKYGQMPLIHTHDVQAYSNVWARALLNDRLTEAMADLIGPNIMLHHTKLFQKPTEKGGGFPMHQDYPYFPHKNHTMAAGIIHISDATEEMGCVRVMPGSHKLGPLPTFRESHDGPQNHYLNPEEYPIEKATPCPAKRGDVFFFNYLTIHGSGLNTSDRLRKTVLVQFRDPADVPLAGNHTASHAQGMMLRGVNPNGDWREGLKPAEQEATAGAAT